MIDGYGNTHLLWSNGRHGKKRTRLFPIFIRIIAVA